MGGYLGAFKDSVDYGIGAVIHDTGSYLASDTLQGLGAWMEEGNEPVKSYTWEDMKADPIGYITDPRGLTSTAGSLLGSSIPSMAAAAAVETATGGLGTGLAAALVTNGARAGLLASRVGKVASYVPKVAGMATGGAIDAASEAGNAYDQAIQQNYGEQAASNVADTVFGDNFLLSSLSTGIELGAVKRAARLGRVSNEVSEGGNNLINAIADFGDKNLATRLGRNILATNVPEAYQEGLQNEFQNSALTGEDINWNPLNMGAESQDQMAAAFFGMMPMTGLGSIRRSRPRPSQIEDVPAPEAPEQSNTSNEAPSQTTPVSPDMSGTMVEGEITPEDMSPVQAEQPSGGIDVTDLNNRIQAYIANPSEYDRAENALYANGDEAGFAYMQARANMLTENPEATFGYNPVSGTKKMSNEDMKSIARTLLQSEDNPDINTEDKAEQMAKLLKVRNDNLYTRNRANQVIQQKRDLGMEVSQAELDNAQKVSPDTGFITAGRNEIKAAIQANKATVKENEAKGTQMMLDSFKNDGERSDFFLRDDGTMSTQGIERVANFGLTPESKAVKNLATRESNKIRQAQSQKVTETVNTIKPGIVNNIRENGVQSKYFSPDGKLFPAVDKELRDAFGGKVDPRITNAITAESKAVLDKERKQSDKNNKARMVLDDQLQKANKINTGENFGYKIDMDDFTSKTPAQRKTKLESTWKEIDRRRQKADEDYNIYNFEKNRTPRIEVDPSADPVIGAFSKYAGKPEVVKEAVVKARKKFLAYESVGVDGIVSKTGGRTKRLPRNLLLNI